MSGAAVGLATGSRVIRSRSISSQRRGRSGFVLSAWPPVVVELKGSIGDLEAKLERLRLRVERWETFGLSVGQSLLKAVRGCLRGGAIVVQSRAAISGWLTSAVDLRSVEVLACGAWKTTPSSPRPRTGHSLSG